MLGCSMSRFSSGDVSSVIGPAEVKHGGGVTNHDSSIPILGNDDVEDVLSKGSASFSSWMSVKKIK